MRKFLASLVLLLIGPMVLSAQDTPFKKSFSLEVGTGLGPYHMRAAYPGGVAEKKALSSQGQEALSETAVYPTISVTGVWRVSYRWELTAVAGIAWSSYEIQQYDAFGTDPLGEPRYDLSHATPAGRRTTNPMASLSFVGRILYTPKHKVVLYGAAGIGLVPQFKTFPVLPTVTPLGVRGGFQHLYFFGELTMSPVASIIHGGLGWKF